MQNAEGETGDEGAMRDGEGRGKGKEEEEQEKEADGANGSVGFRVFHALPWVPWRVNNTRAPGHRSH